VSFFNCYFRFVGLEVTLPVQLEELDAAGSDLWTGAVCVVRARCSLHERWFGPRTKGSVKRGCLVPCTSGGSTGSKMAMLLVLGIVAHARQLEGGPNAGCYVDVRP
jgi:hypothetical protein